MSTNKHALIRYKILDKCFRNSGRKYFIQDLIEECDKVLLEIDSQSRGISRRQIFEDISFMESADGWNIELLKLRDGRKVYYRYADLSFSIQNMPLNETEINKLMSAIDVLKNFRGLPQFEWIHEILPKIQHGIFPKMYPSTIIDFDNNQYLKGIEHIGAIYDAIFYKRVLKIDYKPYDSDKPFQIIMHPYFLKQFNNRWFLFGYNEENDKYDWNLALDRILSIVEIGNVYKINDEINFSEYFEDIIGVTLNSNRHVEDIILHFYGLTGFYMESKPIHGSQKSKWINENTLEISLKIKINYEFERFVLSYADSIFVVKPLSLQKTISKRLVNAFNYYN